MDMKTIKKALQAFKKNGKEKQIEMVEKTVIAFNRSNRERLTPTQLYKVYSKACLKKFINPVSFIGFCRSLTGKLERKKSNGVRFYLNPCALRKEKTNETQGQMCKNKGAKDG